MNAVEILDRLLDSLRAIAPAGHEQGDCLYASPDGLCSTCDVLDAVNEAIEEAELELQKARLITGEVA